MPDRNVEAALKARSAWPIFPCLIGFGLLTPDFVKLRPARSLSFATGFLFAATEKESEGATVDALRGLG